MHEHLRETFERKSLAQKTLALVGLPNVGKSVLFNALTGRYVSVSNYPGTTVDIARGVGRAGDAHFEVIDTPGVYSIVASSEEEKVTRSILFAKPNVIVQVADAKNLSRSLTLTLELIELKIPLVLCLNMKDEALSRGWVIDVKRLSRLLGVDVVETVATTGEGIGLLKEAVARARVSIWQSSYPSEIQSALKGLGTLLPDEIKILAPFLLQNHTLPYELGALSRFLSAEAGEEIKKTQKRFMRPVSSVFMQSLREHALALTAEVMSRPKANGKKDLGAVLGRWLIRPWPGYLIAAGVLWLLYQFVGVLGAQTLVDFFEETLFGRFINPALTQLVAWIIPGRFLQEMLIGPYGVFTMALTYAFALILPIVTTFFLALGVLEDSGYLPRLSVLLDRFFKAMGLNGKAVFPMILGLGCGTMAMLTARILDTKREKLITSFLLALAVPCSAQLGVILAMTAGVSFWVFAVWMGTLVATLLGVGWLTSKILPGSSAPFLLEIPPLRWPQGINIVKKVSARLKWYLKEVVPLFVYATLFLYVMNVLGWLEIIERALAPVVTGFLGLPKESAEAFLVGFLRRDYGAAGFYHLQKEGMLTARQVTVAIVAITLFMPCVAQWLMSLRERGLKATLAISGVVTAYALGVAGALNWTLLQLGVR